LSVPDPDTLANPRCRNAVADRLDLAGTIAVRDHARKGALAKPAAFHVGWIDARGNEAHPHFASAGIWFLDLAHAQHVAGRAHGLVIGSAHLSGLLDASFN
jgi:hypothetical protein